jgi:hypothetical protein
MPTARSIICPGMDARKFIDVVLAVKGAEWSSKKSLVP